MNFGNLLKRISIVFVLLFFCAYVLHSQQYTITEKQLQSIEQIQNNQTQLITLQEQTLNDLKTQITNYQQQIQNLTDYSKKLETKVSTRNSIISITIGISLGCVAGVVAAKVLK